MQNLKTPTFVEHACAGAFIDQCATWLSQQEDLNHGLLSLAYVLRSNRHIYSSPFVFCHVAKEEEILGCAIFAEPDGLVLSEMNSETSAEFFSYLYDKIDMPSRIFGPVAPAMQLAELFAQASNSTPEVHSKWRVHRLDSPLLQEIKGPGQVTQGTMADQRLVSMWGREYNVEKPANVNIEHFLLRKLEDGLLYFWTDGEPKSLATLSGTCCTGPRISSVFTPRVARGRGYAFALVSNLGNSQFASGSSYVTLNTQVGDSVENMYCRIGYRVIGEKASIVFRKNV